MIMEYKLYICNMMVRKLWKVVVISDIGSIFGM